MSDEEVRDIKSVVAIDCTWFQTKKMIESLTIDADGKTDPNLKFIKLGKNYKTTFWRYQHNSSNCLATGEAIYYFFKELEERSENKKDFENLEHILFFYAVQFYKIFKHYSEVDVRGGKNRKFFQGLKKVKQD